MSDPTPCLSTPLLLTKHREELLASGLTDESIAKAKIYSENRPDEILRILNRKPGEKNFKNIAPAIVFPVPDERGNFGTYAVVKPDHPRTKDGKPIKYESPKDERTRPYFPPGIAEKLADAKHDILITEGIKKSLAATQHGFACIGLAGVDGWNEKKSQQLKTELLRIAWNGRKVLIGYDSDAAENVNVKLAESKLACSLKSHGAEVFCIRIPGAVDKEGKPKKVGIDDFLVANGLDAFFKLLASAEPADELEGGLEKADATSLDPVNTVRDFVDENFLFEDSIGKTSAIRFYHDEFHVFTGCRFAPASIEQMKSKLVKWLDEFACNIRMRAIGDFIQALKSLSFLHDRVEIPRWLIEDDEPPFPAHETLPTKNALIHLPSLADEKEFSKLKPSAFFFSTNCLDFKFDPDAPAPVEWIKFLNQNWPNDKQSIDALQEWFGYFLLPDTSQQKILLVVGPPRCGKGTIARVIRGLVGADNVAGPTMSGLSTNFGLSPLLGKSVAIISDARLSHQTDVVQVVERLLSISGEDAITVDRKNLAPVTVRLPVRFVVLTNELPRLGDSSGALASRFIVLKMTESWLGREDKKLTDRLLTELPSILLWAIEGWKRLRDSGRFTQPQSGMELSQEMSDLSSPVAIFVSDCCDLMPDLEVRRADLDSWKAWQVRKSDLFDVWKAWSELRGTIHHGDAGTFGRNLRAAFPDIGDAQPRIKDAAGKSKRIESYKGIKLNEMAVGALKELRDEQLKREYLKEPAPKFVVILRDAIDRAEKLAEKAVSVAGAEPAAVAAASDGNNPSDSGMAGDEGDWQGVGRGSDVLPFNGVLPQKSDVIEPVAGVAGHGRGKNTSITSIEKSKGKEAVDSAEAPMSAQCPAAPAMPCQSPVDFPTFMAPSHAALTHKNPACQSSTGWHNVLGGDFCVACWPPTDLAAVVKGVA